MKIFTGGASAGYEA